ncbi:MAG: TolC family protein [Treponema sp.]|nr:TolC family protein [Treponema sp.]
MKKQIFIVCAAFLTSFCFAQEAKNKDIKAISVDDAVILAADNNVNLKRQRISLDLLEKKDKYSWNNISPSIRLSAGYSDAFTSGVWNDGDYNKLDVSDPGNWSFGGSLSFGIAPSLYTSIKAAQLNYQNGIVSYESAVRSVELSVRKLFYGLIFSKDNIALQERNMETAKVRYENNMAKYSRGQLSELDLLSSQYNYESLKPSIQSAKIAYENDIANFKQLLGLNQSQEIEILGSLDDVLPPEDFVPDIKLEEIPSIKKIIASIELQENSLLATRFSAWGPSLSASYSYNLRGGVKSGSATSGADSFSLSLSIPLDGYLPWASGALSIAAQEANLADLQLQLENEKTSAALSIDNKIKSLYQSKAQIATLEKNEELAQRTYDMTLRAYNAGSKDLLTLQNASDSLMSAHLKKQQQLYSILTAVLDLENTLGIPFGTLGSK